MPILKGLVHGINEPFVNLKNVDQQSIFIKRLYSTKIVELTLFGSKLISQFIYEFDFKSEIIFNYSTRQCKRNGIVYNNVNSMTQVLQEKELKILRGIN